MRKLLTFGPNLSTEDFRNETPLFRAIDRNDDEFVKRFLQKSADSNLKNSEGDAPLYLAVLSKINPCQMINTLCTGGVDSNIRDEEGCTPLHRAISRAENLLPVGNLVGK